MFMRSAWKVSSAMNSAKVGNASQLFSCCSVCTFDDHLVKNQLGSLLTNVCILEGYSKICRLVRSVLAISTCCRKSLRSLRPCALLFVILGQPASLFAMSVASHNSAVTEMMLKLLLGFIVSNLRARADQVLNLHDKFFCSSL